MSTMPENHFMLQSCIPPGTFLHFGRVFFAIFSRLCLGRAPSTGPTTISVRQSFSQAKCIMAMLAVRPLLGVLCLVTLQKRTSQGLRGCSNRKWSLIEAHTSHRPGGPWWLEITSWSVAGRWRGDRWPNYLMGKPFINCTVWCDPEDAHRLSQEWWRREFSFSFMAEVKVLAW